MKNKQVITVRQGFSVLRLINVIAVIVFIISIIIYATNQENIVAGIIFLLSLIVAIVVRILRYSYKD